ncbi:hypothetical protein ABH14_00290 [Brevibacillus brevis]|uniref:hypothetical protein n=1 Tax=Brevibacillus brevis TaxID=1393 RepID=UPI0018FF3A9F|nr:hypothetical protein [Brevibacillus brevis]MBH0328253.1 hypothetical protein [Brevibacillus brevis]
MNNEGFALIYVRDGVAYPVELTEEQNGMLQSTLNAFAQPIHVGIDAPLGEVITLAEREASTDGHS